LARHKASKTPFFAAIAVALIAVGIVVVVHFGLVNQNPVTFTLEGALYKNGELVQSWMPDVHDDPLSVMLRNFAIVFKGPSGDVTLSLTGGDNYELRFYPHANATLNSVTGSSTAAVKVEVVSASATWRGSPAQITPLYGQPDSKTVSKTIAQAQASPVYTVDGFGARTWWIGSTESDFGLPPGQTGQLVVKYNLKATLIVDGTAITSKDLEATATATFVNDAAAPGGTMSVTAWVTSSLYQTPLGTP
jgi:hypothetical protein